MTESDNKTAEVTIESLLEENKNLRYRLTEAEDTLAAIQSGDVDALVVKSSEGDRVFTLEGADYTYRILVESMSEGAATLSDKLNVTYCNQRLSEMTGFQLSQLIGMSFRELVHKEDIERFEGIIKKGRKSLNKGEIRIRRKSGSPITVLLSCSALDIEEAPINLVLTDLTEIKKARKELEDMNKNLDELVHQRTKELQASNELLKFEIQERKKNEEDLKSVTQKLNIALENGNIGTWVWDLFNGNVIMDERTERIFGLEPGTFGGTFTDFELLLHEDDLFHVLEAIRNAIEKRIPFETVFRTRAQNGESKYINSKAIIYSDKEGNVINMTGVVFDVTGMKKGAEQALFKLNEELLRSNKELESFAYIASHDLQEPLRMVSSFTQLLQKRYNDKLDQDAREYIGFAVSGAKRMYDLINSLLAYSRINTKGKEFSVVNMQTVMERVISNLRLKIAERNALIKIDELPELKADEGQMIQLMQNLVENAIKFSPGQPKIDISAKSDAIFATISVKDEGMGIEPKYFERIFQIFQRLVTREEFEGTGIGLSICKRIVERHSGTIWIESELGKGTTFYFTIPLRKN